MNGGCQAAHELNSALTVHLKSLDTKTIAKRSFVSMSTFPISHAHTPNHVLLGKLRLLETFMALSIASFRFSSLLTLVGIKRQPTRK